MVEELLTQVENGALPRTILLCGDSAGGAIAMAVERFAAPTIRGRILGVCSIYGGFGLLDSASLRQWGSRQDGLDVDCVRRFWALANAPGKVSPYAIESLACPSNVPVYILVGGRDPLRDDFPCLSEKPQESWQTSDRRHSRVLGLMASCMRFIIQGLQMIRSKELVHGSMVLSMRCVRGVINSGCRIPNPAYSRLFQLRSEEGADYKERVQ